MGILSPKNQKGHNVCEHAGDEMGQIGDKSRTFQAASFPLSSGYTSNLRAVVLGLKCQLVMLAFVLIFSQTVVYEKYSGTSPDA